MSQETHDVKPLPPPEGECCANPQRHGPSFQLLHAALMGHVFAHGADLDRCVRQLLAREESVWRQDFPSIFNHYLGPVEHDHIWGWLLDVFEEYCGRPWMLEASHYLLDDYYRAHDYRGDINPVDLGTPKPEAAEVITEMAIWAAFAPDQMLHRMLLGGILDAFARGPIPPLPQKGGE